MPGTSTHARLAGAQRSCRGSGGARVGPVAYDKDTQQMNEEDKVIPITRGRRSRVRLIVTPGTTSLGFRVQPIERTRPTARGRPASPPQLPGQLVEFRPQSEKGDQNVNIYTIDDHNRVHMLRQGAVPDSGAFASAEDLEQQVSGWPMRRLVEIWNQLPDVTPVRKFTDRKTAVARIWNTVQAMQPAEPAVAPEVPQKRTKRPRTGTRVAERTGSSTATKKAIVLALLRREGGATLEQVMAATGWQAHSVRGFLSGKISKGLGLALESFRRDDQRVYKLPAGQ